MTRLKSVLAGKSLEMTEVLTWICGTLVATRPSTFQGNATARLAVRQLLT